jgi:hypothetical protein
MSNSSKINSQLPEGEKLYLEEEKKLTSSKEWKKFLKSYVKRDADKKISLQSDDFCGNNMPCQDIKGDVKKGVSCRTCFTRLGMIFCEYDHKGEHSFQNDLTTHYESIRYCGLHAFLCPYSLEMVEVIFSS